jgi:universal stress protein A
MKIQSILFPTDFSNYNDAALEYASTFAAGSGATLHIVHVHDTRTLTTAMGDASYLYAASWHEELEEARRRLGAILPSVNSVTCEHHCLTGVSEEEIVNLAADKHIDLIVMASHGRGGLSRLLMGSVAESVMRAAPCPVLIVKQPTTKEDDRCNAATFGTKTGAIL